MANTHFVSGTTIITASWLNEVDSIIQHDLQGLGNLSSPSTDLGVSMVNGAIRSVDSIAALKTLSSLTNSKVLVNGYYSAGDGGGGYYIYDSADTTSADDGATVIVASDNARWKLQWSDALSILQFGVKADAGVTDNSTNLAKARDWVASNACRNKLYFPAGIYGYTVSPNWGISHAVIESRGEVRLRYSGTGQAFIIDAGFPTGEVYNLTISRFIIEAHSFARNGVYVRSIHHSQMDFTVLGAGTTYAGIRIEFAVCTKFGRPTVSNIEEPWYLGAAPQYGIVATYRNAPESCSYCIFNNTVVSNVETGVLLDVALGNIFNGGTFNNSSFAGANVTQYAFENKFHGTNFYANTVHDVYVQGYDNNFFGIDSDSIVTLDSLSKKNRFYGGRFENITCSSGSKSNVFTGIVYNGFGSGSITQSGTYNSFKKCINPATGVPTSPPVRRVDTVGSSPYTYLNDSGISQLVLIKGGTVTQIVYIRNSIGDTVYTLRDRFYLLRPGDSLAVSYSSVPAITIYE